VSPAALIRKLQKRGVVLRRCGDRLGVRPTGKVTPDELAALRAHKAEILALLTPQPAPPLVLDTTTLREVLGADVDDLHAVGSIKLDVLAAVRWLEAEIATGSIKPGLRLIHGRALAEWLSLDDVARILRVGLP